MINVNLCQHISKKMSFVNRLLLLSILSLPLQNSFASDKLSSLQTEIKKSKTSQTQQNQKRKELEESIATLEQETAAAILKIKETEEAILAERKRLEGLKGKSGTLNEEKLKQQKLLEQQLVSAYMTGENDLVKLLLNQDDISQMVRAKSYYTYLNKARLESIEALNNAQQQLDQNEADQAGSLASLERMHAEQQAIKEKLLEQSEERSKALQELKQDINYQTARLAQLSDAETRLKSKLKRQQQARKKKEAATAQTQQSQGATEKTEDQTYSSISKLKGQLKWPIQGHVLSTFGSQRSSQVKWKGISISANEGEKVRAVATGRVLFAGYFKGYGMVIALDHSDDYITLYGYNQTLLQKTGDIVFQGDAIALAGHSGGQDKNSLYFEISHKGKAEDPLKWLTKRR